ncbi:MAG: glycosyl hydrolase family 17 protein [Rubrivivax sp.]|nr:glycosyl hydrolase family 17 protein [Rubrivivax sp.]
MTTSLLACGGGGTVPFPVAEGGLRPLSVEYTSRKAVSYSPFRSSNRDTETITATMVKQDLDLLLAGGFKLIRLFDSSDQVAKLTLQVIQDNRLDIKVHLGAYIQSESSTSLSAAQLAANKVLNEAEVARAIALANTFRDIVLAVSVGNETMVSWSFVPTSPALMAAYITRVRDQVRQPVTTDDDRAFYTQAPSLITNAIDFAAVHVYPLLETTPPAVASWDWQQQAVPEAQRAVAMMDAAIASAKGHIAEVRALLDGKGLTTMPIVIGETGWKAIASNGEFNRAHPVNQKMYFDRLTAWNDKAQNPRGPANIIYFEAFDEPWKGNDDKWGLFNVQRQARYLIQGLGSCGVTWACETGDYTVADAVFPPTITSSTISANRYTLYADTVTLGEARVTGLQFFGYDSPPNAFAGEVTGSAADGELLHYLEVAPVPAVYGWGLFATYSAQTDLSQFEAAGRLNFSVRTTYPGKLMFGFLTGSGSTAYDVYLPLSPDDAQGYGYRNDGQWRNVSIPISALKAAGAPGFGNNAATARFDLTKVTNPFVVNNLFATSGNTTTSTAKIYIDNIYWSK